MGSRTEKIAAATCCVLSYERPQFLATGLASLVDNAGAELELIIHDDGSRNPEVYTILHEWRERGATVIQNKPGHNQGQGVALNRMFGMAAGHPIIKLDQDLVYHEDWLARVNAILTRNARGGHGEPHIGLLGLMHYHHDPVMSAKCKVRQWYGWQQHTHILGSGFAVTRNCWRSLGPFAEHNPAFGEDWEFQRRVTASFDNADRYSAGRVCALPDEDLASNMGMGPPSSTVVLEPPSPGRDAKLQPINFRPFTFNVWSPE